MDSDRFKHLVDAKGPYASVYFDDSHDTADADAQLDVKLRDLRSELADKGADPAIGERLVEAVRGSPCPVGKSGRALIIEAEEVLFDQHLARPIPVPIVRVSTLPYLVPVIQYGYDQPAFAVVAVDHAGGDIEIHHDGRIRKETVDGTGYPVHKASGAETPGYGHPQRVADNARRKNVSEVADRVTALTDEIPVDVVFIVGEVKSRKDLLSELPERVADRSVELTVGARTDIDEDQLHQAISEEFDRRHRAEIDAAAERFTAELGRQSGLAAEGLDGVTAALRVGGVETLIIGDMGDATVVAGGELATVSPSPEVLSQLGCVSSTRVLRADEALPMAAIAFGASLLPAADELTLADGVGAIRRFSIP